MAKIPISAFLFLASPPIRKLPLSIFAPFTTRVCYLHSPPCCHVLLVFDCHNLFSRLFYPCCCLHGRRRSHRLHHRLFMIRITFCMRIWSLGAIFGMAANNLPWDEDLNVNLLSLPTRISGLFCCVTSSSRRTSRSDLRSTKSLHLQYRKNSKLRFLRFEVLRFLRCTRELPISTVH